MKPAARRGRRRPRPAFRRTIAGAGGSALVFGPVLAFAASAFPALAAEPSIADRELERFLTEAAIVEDEPLSLGITGARRWSLELDGTRRKAVFKTVDVYRTGNIRDDNAGYLQNFSDSYKYDRAAYLLDRRLGLGRVPVVVLRSEAGVPGAVIEWIEDAVDEVERHAGQGPELSPRSIDDQRALMDVFDALIWNDDRNYGNQLWTPDGTMRWIDHSRGFRLAKRLQPGFRDAPARLTRSLHRELATLELDELKSMLGELMSTKRIKAILARRDKILAKIEADLATHGEAEVYLDSAPDSVE